jgi:proline iminopeptidase
MDISVNGTRLWFDVDGAGLVPDGPRLRQRPTLVLVHGGPGSFDHSYLKPHFARLAGQMQVVYLDLRGHGRSARYPAESWNFELCGDDVRAFCDALGIARPVVLGHSLGGFVVMAYGIRHPGHAGALILQSTMARFDLERLADGFRAVAGEAVAKLARREYRGDPVTDEESEKVFAAFGPAVPGAEEFARILTSPELAGPGMRLVRELDLAGQLGRVASPVLVCVGRLDPVTPVGAAQEIVQALPAGAGQLEVIEDAGHFPWLDRPDRYWPVIASYVAAQAAPNPTYVELGAEAG